MVDISHNRHWITPEDRLAIYERDDWKCRGCGQAVDPAADPIRNPMAATLDHIVPRSEGGTHAPENLALMHRRCNAMKGTGDGGASPGTAAEGLLLAAVEHGSRLDVLLALRRAVAGAIDAGPSPRDLSALTIRLSDIDAEVRAIQTDGDPVAEAANTSPDAWNG